MSPSREERIAALPEHLRALLRSRLSGAAGTDEAAEADAVRPVPRGGPLPMSFAQQRMWFLQEFDPLAVGYNSSFALRLRGTLDTAALHRAVNAVVARHESLRTTFDSIDGTPVQIPHALVAIDLPVVDLTCADPLEREQELRTAVERESARPFDLRTGPLLRTLLVRAGERDHVLVLSLHHIIHDGWSLGLFTRQLGEAYDTALSGGDPHIAPAPVQYADFAVRQRERMSGGALDDSLAYWKQQLDGVAPLQLPTDRTRPAVLSGAGGAHIFEVPADVVAGLRTLTTQTGATLFMTLTAAAQLLLARYSRQEDIAVGTPVAGRGGSGELDELIGCFLNTLVLRGRVELEQSFREFLLRTRETVLTAFSHEEVPFEQIVDAVQPDRDPSRMPLAQVLVVLQNMPEATLELSGVTVEVLQLPQASTGFDLVWAFEERPDGTLWAAAEYSADLFDAETVRRMSGHLVNLLRSVAAAPDSRMGRLGLLDPAEHERLTRDWARNPLPPAEAGPVHAMVARRAAERPGAVAVRCGDRRLTYRELDTGANRLARRLGDEGVRPGDVVGVCCERGPDQVQATLAVLKAGAAFLPLHPAFPAARRALMLSETGASLVLTETALLDGLADSGVRTLAVDAERPRLAAYDATEPDTARTDPKDLAYIIYTSGSTGTPKGVLLRHGGLANMIDASRRKLDVGPDMTVCQLSAPSFDGAVWETFTGLASGAVLALPDDPAEALGSAQITRLADGRPTVLSLPPAALAAVEPRALPGGSVILAVGDRCPADLARTWSRSHRFINGYGPTENSVGATMYEGDGTERADAADRLPIGRPLPNVEVHVLDGFGNPVPAGVTGEIHLGGAQVAAGYLGRPDLTARRFVAHPFGDDPEARLYRTGDLAAWLPDGKLDFRGRVDDQVKIRGFRIEPGEIEAAMARHPRVAQAAVVVRPGPRGKRLAGYVVPASGEGTSLAAEVHELLSGELPAFMVPSTLTVLPELPLTTNGKVDRAALPEEQPGDGRPVTRPSGPVETALAEVFASVLGVGEVGADDDFFALGGDSILSTQVVARARQAGLRITTKELFQFKTVAGLARVARAEDAGGGADDDAHRTGPVPLTPVQHWFFAHHTVNPHHFNQSVLLELVPGADIEALRRALGLLMERHDALRTRFSYEDGAWRQEIGAEADGRWHFRRVDLAGLDEADAAARTEEETVAAQRGLHLTDGPLVRAVLFDRGPGHARQLFLTVHHLVVDGVSWRVLLDDLRRAYTRLAAGQDADLGPRSTSFGQWAHRLREHTATGGFDDELAYWRSLPAADEPEDTGTFAERRTVHDGLDAADTEVLLRRVPGVLRAKVDEVLLAMLGQALSGWDGTGPALVDLEGHGREDILDGVDLSGTVGWFTTIYPVALDVPKDAAPKDAVRAVKRQLRTLPRHGIGYGALRHLTSGTGPAGPALPPAHARIAFNYLGQWDGQLPDGDALVARHLDHGGQDHEPAERRLYELEIAAAVEHGRLDLSCAYSPARHDAAVVAGLLRTVADGLRELVRSCA
ncbi:non-ribosomal peptide synthetase [Streptomyces rimosus]|uniref:non-ribosomal peptide synthetase n=1 Tax=Streptomyces rimosus TaxID=1927 RepID=UPI00067BB9E5|nr:non-ribosomal peptide synthetase [Streptomyces rimosus]